MEATKSTIRAMLLSSRAGVRLTEFERQYSGLTGRELDLAGHTSVQGLLRSMPDAVHVRLVNGELVAFGRETSATGHICALIRREKTCGAKRPPPPPPPASSLSSLSSRERRTDGADGGRGRRRRRFVDENRRAPDGDGSDDGGLPQPSRPPRRQRLLDTGHIYSYLAVEYGHKRDPTEDALSRSRRVRLSEANNGDLCVTIGNDRCGDGHC